MTIEQLDAVLKDWILLNERVMELSESEVLALINREKETRARSRVMLRCYNRYSKLRSIREKQELVSASKG